MKSIHYAINTRVTAENAAKIYSCIHTSIHLCINVKIKTAEWTRNVWYFTDFSMWGLYTSRTCGELTRILCASLLAVLQLTTTDLFLAIPIFTPLSINATAIPALAILVASVQLFSVDVSSSYFGLTIRNQTKISMQWLFWELTAMRGLPTFHWLTVLLCASILQFFSIEKCESVHFLT